MNRRDFLRTLGRGASIAGVSPSTVGKMAMNLADSPSPKDNFIKNWIINHYQLLNGGSGSTVQDIEGIKNSYQAILAFLTNKGLKTDWVEDKISAVENWFDDDVIKNALKEYGYDIDDHFTNFIEAGIDGDADYEIYAILFKNNLIDEEMQKYLSKRGIEKQDHITYEDEIKREQEKQKRKEDERKQIAKDINYSRMDKAGGAEDTDYAKYYEKVNTFDTLLEAMDRRGFLRTLGKGAAAAVAPKGAIAKALTAESPVESINTLIRGYLKNDIDGIVNFPKIHSTFTTLFSFIKRHNLDSLLDKKEIRRIEGCIKSSSPEGIQAAIKQIKEMDLEDGFIRNDSNTALHEYEISFGESGCDYDALAYILNPLAQKNLIDKETAKVIKDVMGCDVRDFIQTPEMKAERKKRLQQDTERAMKQYEYNKTAKSIDYSRMDKAGSAEDEGYAKYYEKVNTFDSLLSILTEDDDSFDHLFQNLDTVFYCVIVNWSNIESFGVRVFKNADEFINYYNRCMDGLIASNHSEFFNPANCKKISILDNYYNELIEDIKRFGFIAVGAYPNKSIYFALSKDDVITAAAGDIAEDGDQLYEKIVAILQTKFNKLKG